MIWDKDNPNLDFNRFRILSDKILENPTISDVTMTTFLPLASSRAKALAHKSHSVPSEGWSLNPYPAIHIGCSGVITTRATPAFHPGVLPKRFPEKVVNKNINNKELVNEIKIDFFIIQYGKSEMYFGLI